MVRADAWRLPKIPCRCNRQLGSVAVTNSAPVAATLSALEVPMAVGRRRGPRAMGAECRPQTVAQRFQLIRGGLILSSGALHLGRQAILTTAAELLLVQPVGLGTDLTQEAQ